MGNITPLGNISQLYLKHLVMQFDKDVRANIFDGLNGTYSNNCNYRLMWTCEEQEMTIKAE